MTAHFKTGTGSCAISSRNATLRRLQGTMGIGHTRYPPAGTSREPTRCNRSDQRPLRQAFAHNGNLVNQETCARSRGKAQTIPEYLERLGGPHAAVSSALERRLGILKRASSSSW
jgi:glutamine phosphoribosylpyrophosphate amidotransferase